MQEQRGAVLPFPFLPQYSTTHADSTLALSSQACLLSLMEALAKNKNDVIVANLAEHFGSLGALQSLVSPQRWAVAQDVRFSFQVALDMLFKPGRDLLEQLDVVLGDSDVCVQYTTAHLPGCTLFSVVCCVV